MDQDFRSLVLDWLKRRGWSQARLSAATEISASLVSKHLSEDPRKRVNPSPANLERYAPVLDVSLDDLMRLCGWLPGTSQLTPESDDIEADVRARTQELLLAVRDTPQAFWPEIIKATYDRAIDSVRDIAGFIQMAEGEPSEDRVPAGPEDRGASRPGIRGSNRAHRPIKPRHPALALAT